MQLECGANRATDLRIRRRGPWPGWRPGCSRPESPAIDTDRGSGIGHRASGRTARARTALARLAARAPPLGAELRVRLARVRRSSARSALTACSAGAHAQGCFDSQERDRNTHSALGAGRVAVESAVRERHGAANRTQRAALSKTGMNDDGRASNGTIRTSLAELLANCERAKVRVAAVALTAPPERAGTRRNEDARDELDRPT